MRFTERDQVQIKKIEVQPIVEQGRYVPPTVGF